MTFVCLAAVHRAGRDHLISYIYSELRLLYINIDLLKPDTVLSKNVVSPLFLGKKVKISVRFYIK